MKITKVGFDREIFLHQRYGGVSRGFASIIREFRNDSNLGVLPTLTFNRTNNYYLENLFPDLHPARSFLKATSGWSTLATYGPVRGLSSFWAGGSFQKSKNDVLHATYYRPSIYDQLNSGKLVVTIHDFIPELLGWNGFRNPHIGKSALAKRADLVVCVSETTRSMAIELLKLDESKCRVIHQGVELMDDATVKRINSNLPYLIYVGHRGGYKNFSKLIYSLSKIHSKLNRMKLVIVGPPITRAEEIELNTFLGFENWNALEPQTDAELHALYKNAFAHVVSSGMEGFGMTILESMAQGTPVILNDIPIFREVAGQAGTYFDPSDPESLLAAVLGLQSNSEYESKSQAALLRVQDFSWKHAASAHAQVYREIL